MRNMLLTSAIALFGLAAAPANAMPFPPLVDAPSDVTFVAYGCGPGWTRGPYGRCHPMGGVYVAPPVYGFAAPVYGYGYRPYAYGRRCWWRAGVRVCN
jgi:hypothetical protein